MIARRQREDKRRGGLSLLKTDALSYRKYHNGMSNCRPDVHSEVMCSEGAVRIVHDIVLETPQDLTLSFIT